MKTRAVRLLVEFAELLVLAALAWVVTLLVHGSTSASFALGLVLGAVATPVIRAAVRAWREVRRGRR